MEEIQLKENYLKQINLLIYSIKSFIVERTKTKDLEVNSDKIEEFQNIEEFIATIDEEDIYKNILGQLKLLAQQTDEFTSDLSPENFINEDFKKLSIMYLLLLKTDIKKVLSILPSQLYLTINAMRAVPYKNYLECIDKLTYPELVERINHEGPSTQTRIVLNALTDEIVSRKEEYDKSNLDKDMYEFMRIEVDSRIVPPMTDNKNSNILIKLHADKSFHLKNIRNAEKVNPNLYQRDYADKLDSLEQYNKMEFDLETAQAYLNIMEYLKNETDSKAFAMTKLGLTTLKIMNYIDIHALEVEDLFQLVIKLQDVGVDKYEELLGDKKQIRNGM